jgi:hypothetical protein
MVDQRIHDRVRFATPLPPALSPCAAGRGHYSAAFKEQQLGDAQYVGY